MAKEKKGKKEEPKVEAGFNLGGIFEGLGSLLDVVGKLAEKGEELKKTGAIDIEGLGGKKGKMMYGFTINTMAKGGPKVSSFGNIHRTPEGKTVVEEEREPEVDIFDEKDHVLLVVEMPGIEETDIKLDLKEDILDISAAKGDRKYHKEVLLPSKVKAETMASTYKNGVLEIKIQK
ncbi:MAG: archaeal heat shock protein Hsp20 [Candidatus Margulisiibacteriota bacterium]